jgi:transcription initiation factor TFIID subunit 6
LFYVEDEEMDFEKLINAPLPKVPREITYTAHWLAVEGVQPSLPQNPTQADQRSQELTAKGQSANPTLAAMGGNDNVSVKPLVKHVLSKELQLYFERICSAIMDENNDEYRIAAFTSLRTDPGLHQLVPYFTQFVADKVTHNLKSLFVLTQSIQLLDSILANPSLYIAPYVPAMIPSVLTCLVGKHLGSTTSDGSTAHYALRDFASSLLSSISRKYGPTSSTLRPRIAKSCLKHFLDSHKPFGTHYGAVLGLTMIAGAEGVRSLIIPNLPAYDAHLRQGLRDESRREQAEHVVLAIIRAIETLEQSAVVGNQSNGHPEGAAAKERLTEILGESIATKIIEINRQSLIAAVLEKDLVM